MSSAAFHLPLSKSMAHAKLFHAGKGVYGLTLTDASGRHMGRSVTMSAGEAQRFADEFAKARPAWRDSLIWARLGYGTTDKRPLAATVCHPGRFAAFG